MKSFCSHFLISIFFLIPHNLLATEIIFEYKTKNQINVQGLIAAIHDADIILLGELHDNLFQHRVRADLKPGAGQFMRFYTKNLKSWVCPYSEVICLRRISIIFM